MAGAGGGVCGWVFLAWMSQALQSAGEQSGVLAQEALGEPGAGPAGEPGVAPGRLAGGANLAMCAGQAAGGVRAEDSNVVKNLNILNREIRETREL